MSLTEDLRHYDDGDEMIAVNASLTDEQFREVEALLGYPPNWLGRHKGWSNSYAFGPDRPGRAARTLEYLRDRGIPHSYQSEVHWTSTAVRAKYAPAGAIVRPAGDNSGSEYVRCRNITSLMRWEQPIPGSEEWRVEIVGQLPEGENMTEREKREVEEARDGR